MSSCFHFMRNGLQMTNFLRDWMPPVVWRLGRRLLKPHVDQADDYISDRFHYPLWAVIADRLVRLQAQSVLDLGCGPGAMASLLLERGIPAYLGIDRDDRALLRARRLCPGYSFVVADAFETNLLEAYPYDTFVSTEFLEHVVDDQGVIQRVRPGSRVLISVPSFACKGHVRVFASAAEVAQRYGPYLQDYDVVTQRANASDARFFILEGRR